MNTQDVNPEQAFADAIKALGIEGAPQEFQEEYIAEFGDMVIKSIIVRVLPDMNEEQQNMLNELLEKSDSEEGIAEIFAYFEQNIDDFQTVVTEETARVIQLINEAEKEQLASEEGNQDAPSDSQE